MLKKFGGLTQQLFEKPFRNMLYGIYNFADDERYIINVSKKGYDCDIDDFEYLSLDCKGIPLQEIKAFKYYIENEIEGGNVIVGILLYKGKKGILPIAIKPKSVKIEDVIKGK